MDSEDGYRDLANIGQTPPCTNLNRLCALCDGLCFDYLDKFFDGDMTMDGKELSIHHKGLDALRHSAEDGCHLCSLMVSALRWRATPTTDGAPKHEEVTVCLDWEVFSGVIQIFLVVSCGNQGTKLVVERFHPGLTSEEPSRPFWGSRNEYFLRLTEIDSDPASDRIFSQITSWLRDCSTTHRRCQRIEAGTPVLPTRVVDVGPPDGTQNPYLRTTSGKTGDYIVLSHQWGRAPMFKTTLSELESRASEISMQLLPPSFQDAVTITRKLGKQYLWIDSLCIIQDSRRDWEQESAQMGKYYANAWLTISAAAAQDSHGGILKKRNVLEIRPCKYPRLLKSGREFDEGKFFLPNIGSFMENVQEGILSKRGWILQERVLSRRILHWCRHELYWECTELQASERCPEGGRQNFWQGHQIAQLLRTSQTCDSLVAASPIQTNRDLESQSTDVPQPIQPATAAYKGRPQLLDDAYKFWYKLLEDFCRRDLTVGSDKLPAISGLASFFGSVFRSDSGLLHGYVAGLWATDLPIGLAWRSHLFEWAPGLIKNTRFSVQQTINRNHRVPSRAPSFSWASLDGPIEHPYLHALQSDGISLVPGFEPDVLDVQVTPASGADLFGHVISGRVELSGFIKPFQDPPNKPRLYLDECSQTDMMDPLGFGKMSGYVWSAFERWSHMHCLLLGVVKRKDYGVGPTTDAFCLLLQATGHEQDLEYRRVGFLQDVDSKWFESCARSDIYLV